jgi:hypothetical protein
VPTTYQHPNGDVRTVDDENAPFLLAQGFQPVDDEQVTELATEPELFNPADHTVDQVNAYLEDADEQEQDRVLTEERLGFERKGILGS